MKATSTIALVAVTRRGLDNARLLRQRLRAGEVYRPDRYGPSEHVWETPYADQLSKIVPDLFTRFGQLVFFLAMGAVTRLIADCLRSKESDPGVLVVDEAGRFVIPLLSGHRGGANAFARRVAGCLGATAVITTASDVVGGLSLDLVEDAYGWTAEPSHRLKSAVRALVDGEAVAIVQEIGRTGERLNEVELPENVTFVNTAGEQGITDGSPRQGAFSYRLWITDRLVPNLEALDECRILWYRPKSLVLGVGCERGVTRAALEDGLDHFLSECRFAKSSIGTLATVTLKADEEGILELAQRLAVGKRFSTARRN